jgi:prolipoprotein diacylglyceryltransferase
MEGYVFMDEMEKTLREELEKHLDTLTLYIILGTVIGARLGHCLFYGP